MANKIINDLTAATTVNATDLIPLASGSSDAVKATVAQIVAAGMPTTTSTTSTTSTTTTIPPQPQSNTKVLVANTGGTAPVASDVKINESLNGTITMTIKNEVNGLGVSIGSAAGVTSGAGSIVVDGPISGRAIIIESYAGEPSNGLNILNQDENSIKILAPSTLANYTLTLPQAQGGANSTLVNDGSGNLSWQTTSTTTSTTTTSTTTTTTAVPIQQTSTTNTLTNLNVGTNGIEQNDNIKIQKAIALNQIVIQNDAQNAYPVSLITFRENQHPNYNSAIQSEAGGFYSLSVAKNSLLTASGNLKFVGDTNSINLKIDQPTANYDIILPNSAPTAQSTVQIDAAGQLSFVANTTTTSTTSTTTTTTTPAPVGTTPMPLVAYDSTTNGLRQSPNFTLRQTSTLAYLDFKQDNGTINGYITTNRNGNACAFVGSQLQLDYAGGNNFFRILNGDSSFISFVAPATGTNQSYTWPSAAPPSTAFNRYLSVNSSGNFYWGATQVAKYYLTGSVTIPDVSDTAFGNVFLAAITNTTPLTYGNNGIWTNSSGLSLRIRVSYGLYWSGQNQTGPRVAFCRLNSNLQRFASSWIQSTTDYTSSTGSEIFDLPNNTSIQFFAWQNSGSSKTVAQAIVNQNSYVMIEVLPS